MLQRSSAKWRSRHRCTGGRACAPETFRAFPDLLQQKLRRRLGHDISIDIAEWPRRRRACAGGVRQAERDLGKRSGLSMSDRDRLNELERENRELKRANETLRKASARGHVSSINESVADGRLTQTRRSPGIPGRFSRPLERIVGGHTARLFRNCRAPIVEHQWTWTRQIHALHVW